MKKVTLEGRDFNRLIAATKGFIGKDDRRSIYKYIKFDVEKASTPGGCVTAAACDGYRLSVERARAVFAVDETFSCYIPPCARVPQKAFVEIELKDNDVLIRVEDRIFGCRQPKSKEEFVNYEKFFQEDVKFRVAFQPEYLERAISAAKASVGNVRAPVVLEFRDHRSPVFFKTGQNRENLKMVLPVRIEDGVEYEETESTD